MRYIACAGEVLNVGYDKVKIKTFPDNEEIEVFISGDGILELKEGMQGIFVGKLSGQQFILENVELKKFLDPLYQRNLLNIASNMNLVEVVNDPFPAVFRNYFEYEEAKQTPDQEGE